MAPAARPGPSHSGCLLSKNRRTDGSLQARVAIGVSIKLGASTLMRILSAAYRVLIDGATSSEAVAEMGRYHSPWQFLDARYIYGLSEARRETILREAADWQSRIEPTAQIECASGRCTYVRK